jgi:hypothetical protein
MAQMQALLKIKADVEGEGKVNALGRAIGGLSSTAGKVSGGLRGLAGAAGGLSGALGSLVPLATGAGLLAIAKNAIDAADNLRDMSIRTGVSVEQLSKLKTAAEMSGATIEDVGKALTKTAIAIGNSTSAASNATATAVAGGTTKLKTSIADQLRILEQADARKVSTIKSGAERQIQAVRDGEQRQVAAIERAKDQRIAVLERESDQRMREINRRYRQEEKLLNDSFDDQRDSERRKTDENLNQLEREIDRRYELQQKQIQNNKTLGADAKDAAVQALRSQQDAELATLRNGFEDRAKARDRYYRDQQEAAQQAIDDRRTAEQAAEKAAADAQKKQAEESAKAEKEILEKASAQRIAQIKAAADAQVKAIQDGNTRAQDAYAKLGIALRNADGSQRGAGEVFMDVFDALAKLPTEADRAAAAFDLFGGKLATKLLPLFAMSREEVEKLIPVFTTEFANAADNFNDSQVKMNDSLLRFGAAIGKVLLPVTNLIEGFTKLPGPLQAIVGGFVALTAALVLLAPAISALIAIGPAIAGLKIGATIAGWAGAIIPLKAALAGLLTWIGSTLLPGLLAFFSGPVGWTVLAVAAVVAMAIAFRKPLGDFINWLWNWGEPIRQFWAGLWSGVVTIASTSFNAIGGILQAAGKAWSAILYQVLVQPWVNIWNNVLRTPVTAMVTWLQGVWTGITTFFNTNVVTPIRSAWTTLTEFLPKAMSSLGKNVQNIWTGVVNTIKGAMRNVLQFIANAINSVGAQVNKLINAFNALPGGIDIPRVPILNVPKFAKGGVVAGPTLAMVGEAGPEYIIPEGKMAAASANYLNGARGGAVIPAFANGGFVGGNARRPAFIQKRGRKTEMEISWDKFLESIINGTVNSPINNRSVSSGNTQINVTTGPVMEFDGEKYVTLTDMEKAMRKTADGVYANLRTPSGRYATGVR